MSTRAAVLPILLAVGLTACAGTGATSSTTTDITVTTVTTSTTVDPTTTSTQLTTTTTTTTTTVPEGLIEITVAEGQVVGGGRIPVTLGSAVLLVVEADRSDEVHLHSYDLSAPVSADAPARIEFIADVPGVFEVELEKSGLKLADLEVAP